MGKRRSGILAFVFIGAVLLGSPVTTNAQPLDSFTSCGVVRGRCFASMESAPVGYTPGQIAILKAHASPPHTGAIANVLRRKPGSSRWRQIGTARLNARGWLRFAWHTVPADDDGRLNRIRFVIPGIGTSRTLWVQVFYDK
jgi:hypothetical protein